jgi:hypothetical protein
MGAIKWTLINAFLRPIVGTFQWAKISYFWEPKCPNYTSRPLEPSSEPSSGPSSMPSLDLSWGLSMVPTTMPLSEPSAKPSSEPKCRAFGSQNVVTTLVVLWSRHRSHPQIPHQCLHWNKHRGHPGLPQQCLYCSRGRNHQESQNLVLLGAKIP